MKVRLDRVRAHAWFLPAFLIVVTALPRFVNLSAPLTDRHWIRQTRSAWTSLLYARDGIDLLNPRVPGAGPPYVSILEFPIVQAVVALVSKLGLDIDTSSRLVGAIGFTILAVFVFRVATRLGNRAAGMFAVLAVSVTPFALEWGRSAVVDIPGAALAMAGLDAALMWRSGKGKRFWLLAVAALSVAALIKVTLVVFIIPIVFLFRDDAGHLPGRRVTVAGSFLALIVLGSAVLWNAFSGIAGIATLQNPAVSSHLSLADYIGTLSDRLDPVVVAKVFGRMALLVGGVLMPVWIFIAAYSASRGLGRPQSLAWIAVGAAAFGPIVVFWKVFVVHAYYMAAVIGPVALLVGVAAAELYRAQSSPRASLALRGLLAVWVLGMAITVDYWSRAFDPHSDPSGILPLAAQMRSLTNPRDEVVLLHPVDTDASVLYYADRLGWVYLEPVDAAVINDHCAKGQRVLRIDGARLLDVCRGF